MQSTENKLRKLSERNIVYFTIFLAVLFLSVIPLVRLTVYDGLYVGEEAYYHARMGEYILEQGIPDKDPFIDKDYTLNPYHLVLASLSIFFSIHFLSFILPWILGIGSGVFLYGILKKLKFGKIEKFTTLAVFIISPIFIGVFSTSNSYGLAFFIFVLGYYFFLKKNTQSWISLPLFLTLPFFHLLFIIPIIFATGAYVSYDPSKKRLWTITSAVLILTSVLYGISSKQQIFYADFSLQDIITRSVSDLGAVYGFGFFFTLLIPLGAYILWKKKKQLIPYVLLAVLIVISIFYPSINIFINPVFAIFAAYGFLKFFTMKWKLPLVKNLAIIILVWGLLFSSLSFINRTATDSPNQEIIKSLEWFAGQDSGITLSHQDNGYWIQAIAGKPTFTDLSDINQKKRGVTQEIFFSRNLKATKSLLFQNNISYIWITKDMKEGKVWTKQDEGLLFLFRNDKTFKNLYSSSYAEVWQVLEQNSSISRS